jgi:myo-inositol-1(or 4)-monophosphatase
MFDMSELLTLARDTAWSAVRTIGKDIEKYKSVEQSVGRDVKILADREAEAVILKELRNASPYPILSEESGLVQGRLTRTDYRWIVDPLDGSLNFSRGIPIHCTSIALWRGMEPVLGVVCDSNRREIFSGVVGKGTWLNGKPVQISNISVKPEAVLCTGFPTSTDFSKEALLPFVESIRAYKKIRLLGSAALSLAYVACGRADAYIENDIKLWDVAAGIALVKSACGTVECRPTSKENTLRVIASNGYLC